MTGWKELLKRKRGLLFTLPGAALCSFPIGLRVWSWIQPNVAPFVAINALSHWAFLASIPLIPLSAVCSILAMLRLIDDRDQLGSGIAALLFIFNLLTAFAATSLTTIGQ